MKLRNRQVDGNGGKRLKPWVDGNILKPIETVYQGDENLTGDESMTALASLLLDWSPMTLIFDAARGSETNPELQPGRAFHHLALVRVPSWIIGISAAVFECCLLNSETFFQMFL